MEKGKYIIELADRIPIRNINFYIDACRTMSTLNLQKITDSEQAEAALKKLKNLIIEGGLKTDPQAAIAVLMDQVRDGGSADSILGMKLIGKLIILYLRRGEFNEGTSHFSTLPFNFLSCAVVQDLRLHGHGPCHSFVEKFLDELAEEEIIAPYFHALLVKDRSAKYADEDMAAIFLGYSFAGKGALLPIVPFPSKPAGFLEVLIAELKKLLPRGEANRFIKSFRL